MHMILFFLNHQIILSTY